MSNQHSQEEIKSMDEWYEAVFGKDLHQYKNKTSDYSAINTAVTLARQSLERLTKTYMRAK